MAPTKQKGTLAELEVMRCAIERGYRVSLPLSEDTPYDLVVERVGRNEALQRVQCKFTKSDGRVVQVRCRTTNNWSEIRYTPDLVDWIATYDVTTERCYFVPSALLGVEGRTMLHLRLVAPANSQADGIRWARDYLEW
jgi:hypothetical protein